MSPRGPPTHETANPGEMKETGFLGMPGPATNRLSWMGGRYAYVSAHFDGFTDHCLCIVDLQDITKPVIVSKWWIPGMNRAAGEVSTAPKGKRYALTNSDIMIHQVSGGAQGQASDVERQGEFML